MEIWKDIKGYEGLYQVSNLGRVKSLARMVPHPTGVGRGIFRNDKILKRRINVRGYDVVVLYSNGGKKRKSYSVHQLVAIHFIPNPDNKPEVNHKDGVKTNNVYSNLEWATRRDNAIHAVRIGLIRTPSGSKNWMFGKIGGDSATAKKVINQETGHIYPSARDASKDLGINYFTLTTWLNGKRPNKTPLRYV